MENRYLTVRKSLPLIHCKMHGPIHDTYHPSFVRCHCELDNLYQVDDANLHSFLQQQCPRVTQREDLIMNNQIIVTNLRMTLFMNMGHPD